MQFIKNRWRIIAISLTIIILPLIIILLARKTISLVINGVSHEVITYSLTPRGLLRAGEIPLSESDAIDPPLNSWLRRNSTVTIDRAAQVRIDSDGEIHAIVTPQRIPIVILAEAGIALYPADVVLANGIPAPLDQPLFPSQTHSLQIRRATDIEFVDGDQVLHFSSAADTLGKALWEQGITLYTSDHLEPSSNTPLQGVPFQAHLTRSKPINIYIQGETIQTRSIKTRVGEALSDTGVALQGLDFSLPPEQAEIPDNGDIQMIRVREEVQLEQEPLPFGVSQQGLPELEIDNTQIVQPGEYGLTAKRVRVLYEARPDAEGWDEISRETENEWVAREPQDRIVGYGTKIVVTTTSTADGPIEYWRAVEAFATSYSPCRLGIDGYCNSTTASGKILQKGMIGVVRGWYNYMAGQRVYIQGYGFATIEDIGAGVSGRHWVDLGYTDEDWVSWSATVTVYFLTPVPATVLWILD